MGLEVQYKDLALQLKAKENEVAQLRLSNRGTSNDMRDAKEEIKEMKASMDELKHLAFHYEEYCAIWNKVVVAQCDTAPYFDLNGRQQQSRRGRTFDALQACYKHFLARFMPLDSAERQMLQ